MTPTDSPALPSFVQIEPVGQCNLRCRMCPVVLRDAGGPGRPPAFMAFERYCELIDQFPALSELHLQGLGEPMLHPRFFDMVRYAAARGVRVSTNTNLTAFSQRRAMDCVTSGLERMCVSVDGASPETYAYIRVGGRLDRVLRNLAHLREAKARLGSTAPRVKFVAVLMRRNLAELPDLVRLAHEQGADALSVQHLCHDFSESTLPGRYEPMRAFVDRETLLGTDPAAPARVFEAARKAAAESGVELRLPNLDPEPRPAPPGRPRCDWPWRGAYVSYSGEAMPCCMVATPDRANFGNMLRDAVAPVWSNADYRRFRARLASDDPPEICRGCAIYQGRF
jgi:MoaA/NifB/PqqE/SkfB family radical SAM enzyme